jgi:hypothetical protein
VPGHIFSAASGARSGADDDERLQRRAELQRGVANRSEHVDKAFPNGSYYAAL